jgi:hypothetical protein
LLNPDACIVELDQDLTIHNVNFRSQFVYVFPLVLALGNDRVSVVHRIKYSYIFQVLGQQISALGEVVQRRPEECCRNAQNC